MKTYRKPRDKIVSIRIDAATLAALTDMAKAQDRSISYCAARAVETVVANRTTEIGHQA